MTFPIVARRPQITPERSSTIVHRGGNYYGADVRFEGYMQSGIDREMGVMGFEEYRQTKSSAEPA